ncbi:MAG: hypothetical protein WKF85_14995 [Chitinophagaceae bacterium]
MKNLKLKLTILIAILFVGVLTSFNIVSNNKDCDDVKSLADDAYSYFKKAYNASSLDDAQRYAKKGRNEASSAEVRLMTVIVIVMML